MAKGNSSHSLSRTGRGGGQAAPSPNPTPAPAPATEREPAPLRRFQVEDILKDAKRAGHQNLSAIQSLLDGPRPNLAEVQRQIAEARAANSIPHYVQGPGSLRLGGQTYERGERVLMTRADARDLGGAVAEHEPPPPPTEAGKRTAGRYRVLGPGAVKYGGQFHGPGSEIDLDQDTARDFPVPIALVGAVA